MRCRTLKFCDLLLNQNGTAIILSQNFRLGDIRRPRRRDKITHLPDVLATGGTVAATRQLVEGCGGTCFGAAVLMAFVMATFNARAAFDVTTLFAQLAKNRPAKAQFQEKKYLALLDRPIEQRSLPR